MSIHDKPTAPVIFVSDVAAAGFLNGVANFSFITFQWLPVTEDHEEGTKVTVQAQPFVSANLRMDLYALKRLRDEADRILQANTTAAAPSKVN